jgi:hypothetical protein
MRFWTAIVGYNPRDRSLSQRIYLIYVVIFFSLWGFAVLALLANLGAGVLSLFKGLSPAMAATVITAVALLADALLRGYQSGRRSPFIFSEEDAALICQTSVDRRQVALAWLGGDWLPAGIPFWAGAVALAFASLQLSVQGGIVWVHLPIYLLMGLRAASIVLPLHLAFMAADYALGALRLRGDKELSSLRWIPVGIATVMTILALINPRSLQVLLWPVLFSLESGFGATSWLAGFCISVFLVGVGILALYLTCAELNLSRAAQESHFQWVFQQVSILGDSELIQQMKTRQRLGAGHPASHIPARAGLGALIWKDWVQSLRRIDFISVMSWLGLCGVSLGMIVVPDWGSRIWAFVFWGLLIGQRCTERFRSDLQLWAVFRLLPFPARETLLVEIASPVLGATVVTWLAFAAGSLLGFFPGLMLIVLSPGIIFCIALAAVFDILRQSKTSDLLAGQAAGLGAVGLIFGLLLAGLPLAISVWVTSQMSAGVVIWLVSVMGLLFSLGIAYGMWRMTTAEYKNLK